MTNPKEEWKDEFRSKFVYFGRNQADQADFLLKPMVTVDGLESFIEKTLTAERARIAEQVEAQRVEQDFTKNGNDMSRGDFYNHGWNRAVDAVLSLLQTP